MKFLGTSTQQTKNTTSCDAIEDKVLLSGNLGNLKKSFRYKKYNQVRISEIDSFCPREYALGFLTNTAAENFVDFALQQQMDLGSAIHWYYQNKSKVYKNTLHGYWMCKACDNLRKNKDGSDYFGTRPSNKTKCETCGANSAASEFHEYMFRVDEPYPVVGKMDGVLEKEGVFRFLDFKSYWDGTNLPNSKDISQLVSYGFLYEYLPKEMKLPVNIDTKTSYLIYISKKFSYNASLLTYPVKQNKKHIDAIIDRLAQFKKAKETGELPPPFDICIKNNWQKGRAAKCYLKEKCQAST